MGICLSAIRSSASRREQGSEDSFLSLTPIVFGALQVDGFAGLWLFVIHRPTPTDCLYYDEVVTMMLYTAHGMSPLSIP
jgi:hypothetical protein